MTPRNDSDVPTKKCPACGGLGVRGSHNYLCVSCKGQGVARKKGAPMTPCNDTCGAGSASGRNGEMLLCGRPAGHDGEHAWASLPTFVNGGFVGNPYRAGSSIKEPRASVWDEGYAAAVAAHGTADPLPGEDREAQRNAEMWAEFPDAPAPDSPGTEATS